MSFDPLQTAWTSTGIVTWVNYLDFFARIALSIVCGALIGLERERRMKNAGIRTHMTVAFTAAMMMILSKYAYFDLLQFGELLKTDTSRIAHGVVSAIGFLGAGVIFIRKDNPVGITTAAGMWATVGIGLSFGAGLYIVGIVGTVAMMFIQRAFRSHHKLMPHQMTGTIRINLTAKNLTIEQMREYFEKESITVREVNLDRKENGDLVANVNVFFAKDQDLFATLKMLDEDNVADSEDVYPILN